MQSRGRRHPEPGAPPPRAGGAATPSRGRRHPEPGAPPPRARGAATPSRGRRHPEPEAPPPRAGGAATPSRQRRPASCGTPAPTHQPDAAHELGSAFANRSTSDSSLNKWHETRSRPSRTAQATC
jgi:hypothetical protein